MDYRHGHHRNVVMTCSHLQDNLSRKCCGYIVLIGFISVFLLSTVNLIFVFIKRGSITIIYFRIYKCSLKNSSFGLFGYCFNYSHTFIINVAK